MPLKRLKQCLSEPLTMLYNQSLSVGYVPPEWHATHIVPVHKKGITGDVSNLLLHTALLQSE